MTSSSLNPSTPHPLDALTHGAFSAPTAGERAARIRDWLATQPSAEGLNQVFRELSARDKGAARPIREKLDELKRARNQESLGIEWAERGRNLLQVERLNIADALAWQRDAAKAGAPLSREPLLSLKAALAARVQGIEDLQHRVMVQREAAVLLAQRIELLSTKSWRDAQAVHRALSADIALWQQQGQALADDASWPSVEAKFPPLLDGSGKQLLAVWNAFDSALTQVVAAASDVSAEMPAVPIWAEEVRAARALAQEAAPRPARPKIDPEVKAHATEVVSSTLQTLESEIALGHGKASAGAANALRNALREHARLIDERLDHRAHAALAAAEELEGWQRWRADQLREELLSKAEGLLQRPEGQALGGRKMQEALRGLREQWKQADHGGAPNHGLWRRFDEACNEAYKVVQAWLDRIKAEAAMHREQRLALIEELRAWSVEQAQSRDWKALQRCLFQFSDRWRDAGHLNEKALGELQGIWNQAFTQAASGLEAEQARSRAQRLALIQEAELVGAAAELRVDDVRALQQRWQLEAQAVPLERRFEQKLWDSFRRPIDAAFQRKTLERERAAAQRLEQMSDRDRKVMAASQQLEEAGTEGDAQKIRAAKLALEAVLRGDDSHAAPAVPLAGGPKAGSMDEGAAPLEAPSESEEATAVNLAPPPKPAKAVIAVRGDDRPGMKRTPTAVRPGQRGARPERGRERTGGHGELRRADGAATDPRGGEREAGRGRESWPEPHQGPRLGDQAFRAQREAMERAELALRKLSAQAHGEVVTNLMSAWEQRDAKLLPTPQALGPMVNAATRSQWAQSLAARPDADSEKHAAELRLRLEIAAELPTPAEYQEARRAMQLFLLTKRNEPAPAQTWPLDLARLLSCAFEPAQARRVQQILKTLFKR